MYCNQRAFELMGFLPHQLEWYHNKCTKHANGTTPNVSQRWPWNFVFTCRNLPPPIHNLIILICITTCMSMYNLQLTYELLIRLRCVVVWAININSAFLSITKRHVCLQFITLFVINLTLLCCVSDQYQLWISNNSHELLIWLVVLCVVLCDPSISNMDFCP